MISVKSGVRAEEVLHGARHVLFVEGASDDSFDPAVLQTLFENKIRVAPLGPSFHVKSVAEALHKHHPDYYFLIDRDDQDDDFVESCWENFPDPNTSNLLVWRKREIENYFLDVEYLLKSEYLASSEEKLRKEILDCCRKRIYLEAANRTIVCIREEQKQTWIQTYDSVNGFESEESAIERLVNDSRFAERANNVKSFLHKKKIETLFIDFLDDLSASADPLEWGKGRWLDLMRGKRILPQVVNQCFNVMDSAGKRIQGKEAIRFIVKELIRKPIDDQPADFRELFRIIEQRVKS